MLPINLFFDSSALIAGIISERGAARVLYYWQKIEE